MAPALQAQQAYFFIEKRTSTMQWEKKMGSDNIRIGVIGVGAIGPSHVHAIERTGGCELAAICDIRPDVASGLAAEHGVPYFSSVGEMVKSDAVDAATICTPSGFHMDAALEVITAGKHLLVEKPLEITTDRIDPIIAAAEKQGITLANVFQSRFRPIVRELKPLIDAGLVGEIYSASAFIMRYRTQEYYDSGGWRGTWKVDGGGCLMNQGIHLIDLLLYFAGDAEEVIAITETMGRNIEVETLALALVKFTSGAKGMVQGTTLAYPEFPQCVEIVGSRGTAVFTAEKIMSLDLIDPTPEEETAREELMALTKAHEEKQASKKKDTAPGTAVPGLDMGHAPVFEDFVEAIRTGRDPLVPGKEARRSVELINAIYESGRNNSRPVRLRK